MRSFLFFVTNPFLTIFSDFLNLRRVTKFFENFGEILNRKIQKFESDLATTLSRLKSLLKRLFTIILVVPFDRSVIFNGLKSVPSASVIFNL